MQFNGDGFRPEFVLREREDDEKFILEKSPDFPARKSKSKKEASQKKHTQKKPCGYVRGRGLWSSALDQMITSRHRVGVFVKHTHTHTI